MSRAAPTSEAVVGSTAADPSAPHFYNPHAVLSLPVTVRQVTRFRVQDAPSPALTLPDGTYYYGDVDVPGRIGAGAVPHGVGIILFKVAPATTRQSPPPAATAATTGVDSPPVTLPAPSESGNENLVQTCQAFESGDRYGGSWSFGAFEGHGVLVTSTFTYQGNWSCGKMHGKGHMTYTKNFVDRMPDSAGLFDGGVGAFLWRGLAKLSPFEDSAHKPKDYSGDFDRGQLRHGYGIMSYYNGDTYEGQWQANRRHGKGKLTQADGEVYEGEWVKDVRQGYGTISYPDGRKFKGHLQRGARDGEGVLIYANGNEYYGHFSCDNMEGQGTMRYKNGDLYEGEWKDGMRNGKGKYTLKKKKSIVQGVFVNGLIHGPGTVENPGVSLFVGEFQRGERSEGTMFFFKGAPGELRHVSCYQGEWASEHIHGKGLMWWLNGDFYYGEFARNVCQGQGNKRYAEDGSEYSGGFVNNRRDGWGIWQRADGFIKAGRWSADHFIEGYEGEWDGRRLNGVGHLRFSFETFLFGPQENSPHRKKKGKHDASPVTSQSVASLPASRGHDGEKRRGAGEATAEGIAPGEAVEFFGLFKHGRRDGSGVLRVPAVLSELFPSLPVPSYRHTALPSGVPEVTTRRGFFFTSSSKKAAAAARAQAEVVAAAQARRRACGVADDVEVGEDVPPVCPARHVIKGTWRDGVLEGDQGVWAFPSGDVYTGPFRGGKRGGGRRGPASTTWLADGSVHVGAWEDDAPVGEGLYFAKNLRDPQVWTQSEPAAVDVGHDGPSDERVSQTKREASLRQAAVAAPSAGETGPASHSLGTATASPTSEEPGAVFNFFSTASHADVGVPSSAVATAGPEEGAHDHEDAVVPSAGAAVGRSRRRRVLLGYGEHYLIESEWVPCAVSEMSYLFGLQPQPFPGPRPVDSNPFSTVMDALGYLPEPAQRQRGLSDTGDGGAGGPHAPHGVSAASLTLPSTVSVGRVEDHRARVWFYGSGVCVESAYSGNRVRLAVPHRPNSLFDIHHAQVMQSRGVLPSAWRAPSQQSGFSAWLAWHKAATAAAAQEHRKRSVEEALHEARQHDAQHATAQARLPTKTMDADARELFERGPPAVVSLPRCTFCGKEFGMFRKSVPCTLCFRAACSSCLGNLELTTPSDASSAAASGVTVASAAAASASSTSASAMVSPVHAVALTSYALLQAALAKPTQSKKEAASGDEYCGVLQDIPTNLELYRDELVSQGITSVPTCVDCVRSLLLKLQVHTMWIPSAMFPNAQVAATRWCNEEADDAQEGATQTPRSDDTEAVSNRIPHAEESQRRAIESLEASLPSHSAELPSTSAVAEEDTRASPVRAADRPTTTASVGRSPEPHPPASPPPREDKAPSVAASVPRPPPTFYVVYSGYTTGQLVPHVFGELWWGQRAYYRGGFHHGQRHGFGTQIFMASGEQYVGEFQSDAWHGFGLFFYADGSVLHGLFERNKLVKAFYRGEVDEQWRPHGRGTAGELGTDVSAAPGGGADGSAAPRASYNGEWCHGKRHGTGVYQCVVRRPSQATSGNSNGGGCSDVMSMVYSGTFVHDAIDGTGKLVTAESAYYGQFRANEKHGKGVEFFSESAIEGTWSQGLLDGFCRIFSSARETIYETTYSVGNERDDCFPPPLMVDDAESTLCTQCGVTFTLFTRRHHCRLCGNLCCDACSQQRAQLPAHFGASAQGQQRVCDACFDRLAQRRHIAICRYRDGAVYAGCWSHGKWVARGLYCRADGLFFVFNNCGELIRGAAADETVDASDTAATSGAAAAEVGKIAGGSQPRRGPSSPLRDEVTLSRQALDSLPVSSPLAEVDAFILWWASSVARCQLRVALDVPMLQHLQARRRTEPALTPARAALAKGVVPMTCISAGSPLAQQLSAVAVRAALERDRADGATPKPTSASLAGDAPTAESTFFAYPSPPPQPTLRLFAPLQQYLDAAAAAADVVPSASQVGAPDDAIQEAARRAARFTPFVAPAMPSYPPPPSCSDAVQGGIGAQADANQPLFVRPPLAPAAGTPCGSTAGSAPVRVALPKPPAFSARDLSDEAVLKRIAEERVSRFLAWPPPSETAEPTAAADGDAEVASSALPTMPLLTCYSHEPLLKPTPLPPESGTNVKVEWEDFSTRSATALIGPSPRTEPREKASTGREAAGENPDVSVLFACPFLAPAVPDVQQTLEVGKIQQVASLLVGEQGSQNASADKQSDDAATSSLLREAWQAHCRGFLDSVPSATEPVREALQKDVDASPFAAFFVREYESRLFQSRGAGDTRKDKSKPPAVSTGRHAVTTAPGADPAVVRSDIVGWLPGLLRGPLESTTV